LPPLGNLAEAGDALHGLKVALARVHPPADAVEQVAQVGVAEDADEPGRPAVRAVRGEGEVRDGAPQAREGGAVVERLARIVARQRAAAGAVGPVPEFGAPDARRLLFPREHERGFKDRVEARLAEHHG
jgi:hypothetical protein